MRQPFGAVVFAEVRAAKPVASIHELAVRVGIDGERAGVNAFGNAKFAHEFEHVAGVANIDLFGSGFIACADLVPGREVEDAIYTVHRCAHAFFVSDVAERELDTALDQGLGLGRIANERNDLVPSIGKLARDVTADETGCTGNEVFQAGVLLLLKSMLWRMKCVGNIARRLV